MNNNKIRMTFVGLQKQKGMAVIATVLVLLLVLTLVGLMSAKKASIETKMTTNTIDRQKAFIAAGSAVKYAWSELNATHFDVKKYVSNCDEEGIYDLRANASSSCSGNGVAKTDTEWDLMTNNNASGWQNTQNRKNISNNQIQTTMSLAATPQYMTGIRRAIERKGTEGSYCVPVSIIGSGTGGTDNARSLVEVNAIPRSGCFRKLIQ